MLPWHLAKRILRVLECFSNEMRERINEKMQIFKAKLTLILRIVQSEKKIKDNFYSTKILDRLKWKSVELKTLKIDDEWSELI